MIRKIKLPIILPATMSLSMAIFASLAAGASVSPAATSQALRKAVVRRLAHLQNVVVTYDMDVDYPPNHRISVFTRKILAQIKKAHPGAHFGPPLRGHYMYTCCFSFLNGRMRYDKTMTPATVAKLSAPGGPGAGLVKSILTITPERAETLQYQLHFMKAPIGTIAARASLPSSPLPIVWALGLRSPPFPPHDAAPHWLNGRAIRKIKFARTSPVTFSLMQRRPDGYRYQWLFRTKPALELVGIIASFTGFERYRRIGIVRLSIGKCSDFHKVGGLLLPGRIVETGFFGGKYGVLYNAILTKIKYTIGAAANTSKSYFILWPTGSSVIDERLNNHVFHVGVHRTRLTDKEIFSILRRQDHGGKIKPATTRP